MSFSARFTVPLDWVRLVLFDKMGDLPPYTDGKFSDYVDVVLFYFESVDLDDFSLNKDDKDYAVKIEKLASKRRAVLLSKCGPSCFKALREAASPRPIKEVHFDEIIQLGIEHFDNPKILVTLGRYTFCKRVRGEGETFSAFHKDLILLAEQCLFGNSLNERLTDQIVAGVSDEEVLRKLLAHPKIGLSKTLEICSSLDAVHEREVGACFGIELLVSF